MDYPLFEQDAPLCKFGPGGDYSTTLSAEQVTSVAGPVDKLKKLLSFLGEFAGSVSEVAFNNPGKEFVINANRKTTSEPSPVGNIENYRRFSDQKLLFADAFRNGRAAGSKPKHRLRTSVGPASKKASNRFAGQGSLFEADCPVAKTA